MSQKCQNCPGTCSKPSASRPMDKQTDEPIADLVPMPDNALSEFEMVTKNALAVGMLSVTDRRALGAMGYFAAETALFKPMVAIGINNVHRNIHEMIQSGVDPMDLWKIIITGVFPAEQKQPEPIKQTDAPGSFATIPDGYLVWLPLPETIKAEDIEILEPSMVSRLHDNTLTVTMTRPPRPGEEDVAEGIDVDFPGDGRLNEVTSRLEGNMLRIFVPRPLRAKHAVEAVRLNGEPVPAADPPAPIAAPAAAATAPADPPAAATEPPDFGLL